MLRRVLIPLAIFLLGSILYIHNLSPSVYGGDVGDVVTAAYLGGVPHAPGYPLFTLLGFIFAHLFAFFTPAFSVGLISAFSGAGGLVFFFLTLRKLKVSTFASFITTITLGTNYLFWFYNEIAEVFALNTFFIILLFFLSISFSLSKKKKYLFLFLFFLGLSFTHHQIIIFFVPSFLLLITSTLWKERRKWKSYVWGICFFFLGLLPYVYIPIASSFHPAINWDSVHDISSFLHLILRMDYGTFQAGGEFTTTWIQRMIILQSYAKTVLLETTIPVIIISLFGVVRGVRLYKRITSALIAAYILSGPFFITYAGFPLSQNFFFGVNERFFTMSSILIFYFFAFGLEEVCGLVISLSKRSAYSILFLCVFLLIPIQLFFYNFPKTDLSHIWIGDLLGKDMLTSLPPHALFLLGGDTALFNTEYVHYALHFRPDVEVANFANLQMNSYVDRIEKQIIKRSPSLTHQLPLLAIATVQEIAKTRPVFSVVQMQGGKTKLTWAPFDLYYEYIPTHTIPLESIFARQTGHIWSILHIPQSYSEAFGSLTISEIPSIYSNAALVTGAYFNSQYHDVNKAKEFYEKAIQIDPSNSKANDVLGLYYLTDVKQCNLAKDNLTIAMEKNPSDEVSYILLYATYQLCLHKPQEGRQIASKYQQRFGQDIVVALKKTLAGKGDLFQ